MKRCFSRALALGAALLLAMPAAAEPLPGVDNEPRARVNYMLNCQGCHGPQGAGTPDGAVPRMRGVVAKFLELPEGRDFLVRVPGSANSALSNAQLAEVLNWMLWTISRQTVPEDFLPYTAQEVQALRAQPPLVDVVSLRTALIERLGAGGGR